MEANARRRKITIFSLGGTIASIETPGKREGVVPTLGADDLVASVPSIGDVADIETVSFRQTVSGDLTFADLTDLAHEIDTRLANGIDGVVVTQGTDSIEETSFALDLLVDRPRPIVMTGAMRNPTLAGPDGPANILAAAQVAADDNATGLGCVVVLNDTIHAARFVHKTNTSNPATFKSAPVGAVGWVTEGLPRIALRPAAHEHFTIPVDTPFPPVALLTMSLGDTGRFVSQVRELGFAGLVVEAFGGGHVPSPLAPMLGELARDIPVILASRTRSGSVLHETYGFPGSERDLLARGLISARFLDGLKARVLLSMVLASGGGTDEVRRAFNALDPDEARVSK